LQPLKIAVSSSAKALIDARCRLVLMFLTPLGSIETLRIQVADLISNAQIVPY